MAESFSEIGKIQAIEQLYRLSAYNPVSGLSYTSSKGGRITTASRMYLEGIDFNLVYFPLKHLGYKCVVGVTGELYADVYKRQSARRFPKYLSKFAGFLKV